MTESQDVSERVWTEFWAAAKHNLNGLSDDAFCLQIEVIILSLNLDKNLCGFLSTFGYVSKLGRLETKSVGS